MVKPRGCRGNAHIPRLVPQDLFRWRPRGTAQAEDASAGARLDHNDYYVRPGRLDRASQEGGKSYVDSESKGMLSMWRCRPLQTQRLD